MKRKIITQEVLNYFKYDETSPSHLTWDQDYNYRRSVKRKGEQVNFISTNGYYKVWIMGYQYLVHRVIYFKHHPAADQSLHIDHIDGNRLNNCIDNLRLVNVSLNMQNRYMGTNNTSGVVGVSWHPARNRWRAAWVDTDGKYRHKNFPISKYNYSKEESFDAAVAFRKEKILELNNAGKCYTERHGT